MKRDDLCKNSGKPMTTAYDTVQEASFKLRAVACPTWSDTKASSLRRAARSLGLSASQARRIIYREGKRIDAHVLDNIRAAYQRLEARAELAADLQLARAQAAQEAFHAGTTNESGAAIGMDRREDFKRS